MTRALRVLQTGTGPLVAEQARELVRAARERDIDLRIAAPRASAIEYERNGPVPLFPIQVPETAGPGDAAAILKLRYLGRGADVIHAHGERAGAMAVLAARSLGSRRPGLVASLHHSTPAGSIAGIRELPEVLLARGADRILADSPGLVATMTEKGAKEAALAVIAVPEVAPPHVDALQVRTRLEVGSDAALLVSDWRDAADPGLDLLLDAAGLLELNPQPITWLVAAPSPVAHYLNERAQAEGLSVRGVEPERAIEAMSAADLVVSTAHWEGAGIGLRTALGLGAAILATDVDGTREAIADAGYLVSPDADQLAAGVRTLLGDPGVRAELAARAMRRASELPSFTDLVDQFEAAWRAASEGLR